jgi:hypothetical protein
VVSRGGWVQCSRAMSSFPLGALGGSRAAGLSGVGTDMSDSMAGPSYGLVGLGSSRFQGLVVAGIGAQRR